MNVKAGDMAILIKSAANNEGKICEVISFAGDYTFKQGVSCSDAWLVDFQKPTVAKDGSVHIIGYVSDAWLRPISGLPINEDADINERVPA